MEFENLLTLIKTVSDSELTEFSYEENGSSIHLKKKVTLSYFCNILTIFPYPTSPNC